MICCLCMDLNIKIAFPISHFPLKQYLKFIDA